MDIKRIIFLEDPFYKTLLEVLEDLRTYSQILNVMFED